MNTLYEYFENENVSNMGLAYNAPEPYTGTATLRDGKLEPFEFIMRVNYKVGINFKQLSFYMKQTSILSDLIINIMDHIESYQTKANDVVGTPKDNAELSIGSRKVTFSTHYYFYTENRPTEQEIEILKNYFTDKPFSIQIRSMEYVKYENAKQNHYGFISHDSRDKDLIARPLAAGLNSRLCPVWFDEYSLKLGDNLRTTIEKGITNSKKCILITTKNFLANPGWTKTEFDSIFAKEMVKHENIIIPIWYGVTIEEVYEYCPSLTLSVALIWPSNEGKTTELYNKEVQKAIDKIYIALTAPDF